MALVIEAPKTHYSVKVLQQPSLFMAGGITGCYDWQQELIKMLKNKKHLTIFNPRRKNFNVNNPKESEKQIVWEFIHLAKADAISFWFSNETVQPITLFELGRWCNYKQNLFVGVHPEYSRKDDVLIQMSIVRPSLQIVDNLEHLAQQIMEGI